MRKFLSIAAGLLFLLSQQAHAFGVSPAVVYSNLNWNVSSNVPGLTSCNNMRLDGNGNLATSNAFVAYGAVNCAGFGYSATGSGYIGSDGSFNMTLTFAAGAQLVCSRLNSNTLTGTCAVYNSAGSQIGTAFIGYAP